MDTEKLKAAMGNLVDEINERSEDLLGAEKSFMQLIKALDWLQCIIHRSEAEDAGSGN